MFSCAVSFFSNGQLASTTSSPAAQAVSVVITLPGRLELPTLRLTASRSNQLSYGSACAVLAAAAGKQMGS